MIGFGIGVCGQRVTRAGDAKPASDATSRAASATRDNTSSAPASTAKNSATGPSHFAIRFYGKRAGVKYQYADLTTAVGDLASQEAIVTLTEDDVASFQADAAPSSRFVITLTAQAAQRWSAALKAMSETQPFTVAVNGETLYVGVVYNIMGAAAIQTPVLHLQEADGKVELRIGAWQGAWYGMGRGDASRIERKEIRELFAKQGVLTTLPAR